MSCLRYERLCCITIIDIYDKFEVRPTVCRCDLTTDPNGMEHVSSDIQPLLSNETVFLNESSFNGSHATRAGIS